MSSDRLASQTPDSNTEPFFYQPAEDDTSPQASGGSAVQWAPQGVSAGRNTEAREKLAFEKGLQEGEARVAAAFEQKLAAIRASVSRTLEEFKAQRELYFNRVEPEIVQLALAIARKILHREAQMDPTLLTGIVRVALEKLDTGTRVRLKAHPEEIHFWKDYFSTNQSYQPNPELVGDAALQQGECMLEAEVGSTQISLETQLKEIEQGFFDLLDQRPRVR
jgi:flagellar assembly protein FliH